MRVDQARRGGAARTLIRGTSWTTAAQLIPLVFNLAITPWVIHNLGPERYSIFLIVSTFTMLLGQFDGGIGPSAMRFFTLYAGRDDRASATRLLLSVSAVVFATGTVVTALAFIFTAPLLQLVGVEPRYFAEASFLLRVLTGIIAFIMVRNLLNALINARQLFRFTSVALLLGYVVYMTGMILSIVNGWGLYGVALAMVLQQVVGSAVTVPPALRHLVRVRPWHIDRTTAGEFFRYAWKIQVTGLAGILTSQKDQLVAGWLLSAQQSGPFGQGTNFATQLRSLPLNANYPMQALTGAEIGRAGAAGAVPKITTLQRIWVRFIVGWCGIGAVAAFFAVRAWMPDSYDLAGPVAAALIFATMFQLTRYVANLWCLSLGHPEIQMSASLVGFATNVALTVVLGLAYGMTGVVAATVAGQLASMLSFNWQYVRRVEVRLPSFMKETPVMAAVAGMGVTLGCEILADGHLPRGALGLVTGALVALPGVAAYLLLAFRRADLATAKAMLRRG